MIKNALTSVRKVEYLHGIRTKLLLRSGTHGLNEQLGRHRRDGSESYTLCGDECGNTHTMRMPSYKHHVL